MAEFKCSFSFFLFLSVASEGFAYYLNPLDIVQTNGISLKNSVFTGIKSTYNSDSLPLSYSGLHYSPYCVEIKDHISSSYIISQVDRVIAVNKDFRIKGTVSIVGGNGGNGGDGAVGDGGGGGGATFGSDPGDFARGGQGKNGFVSVGGLNGIGAGGKSNLETGGASGGQGGNGSGGGGGGGGLNGTHISAGGGQGGGYVLGGSGGGGCSGTIPINTAKGGDSQDSSFKVTDGQNGVSDLVLSSKHYGGCAVAFSTSYCVSSGGGNSCNILGERIIEMVSHPGKGGG